ncbi:MAG: helix-turn-helix domain-containing protein [Bilifractor sp.]|nr:helix-turn-helix domain-containing protein [Eubacterium sp.]
MYRILLADDEGITIDSLTFIMEKEYHDKCELRSARSGRAVIEMAETFRPDIAVMDIRMPGIDGIEAIREIRKFSPTTVFIVLTAYDKFSFAKDAINLGVLSFLTKPLDRKVFVDAMNRAMASIDKARDQRSRELSNREKLDAVVPMIESGLVYSLLLQDNTPEVIDNYRRLLEIPESYGFIALLACGDALSENLNSRRASDVQMTTAPGDHLSNPIGTGIRLQKHYSKIREILKEYSARAVIGQIMMNKIPVFIPYESSTMDYLDRVSTIDQVRKSLSYLTEETGVTYRIGIGSVKSLSDMRISYQEALRSLRDSSEPVSHADDLPVTCSYEQDYPLDLEKQLFESVKNGSPEKAAETADLFFTWMEKTQVQTHENNVRLKAIEFVLWAEHIAYRSGGIGVYRFGDRGDYLSIACGYPVRELHSWFVEKIRAAAEKIADKTISSAEALTQKAKEYIGTHYAGDLSLDEVSRALNISPYYFSRIFKETEGVTFIEYLTDTRLRRAKELLAEDKLPVKEICSAVGYQDPNYFSRLFRRSEGVSPTEYKETHEKQ